MTAIKLRSVRPVGLPLHHIPCTVYMLIYYILKIHLLLLTQYLTVNTNLLINVEIKYNYFPLTFKMCTKCDQSASE